MNISNNLFYMHLYNQVLVTLIITALYLNKHSRVKGVGFWVFNLILYCLSLLCGLLSEIEFMVFLSLSLNTIQMVFFILGFRIYLELNINWKYVFVYISFMVCILAAAALYSPSSMRFIFGVTFLIIGIDYLRIFIKGIKSSPWANIIFRILFVLYLIFYGDIVIQLVLYLTGSIPQISHILKGLAVAILTAVNYTLIILINNELIHRNLKTIIESENKLKNLKILAEMDELTELLNRRKIQEYLASLILETIEAGNLFTIYLVDINSFKQINDTYGHDTGDAVLKRYAVYLKNIVAETDIVGRWGGDEFLIISSISDEQAIFDLKEKLKSALQAKISAESVLNITCCCGYSTVQQNDTVKSLIKRADIMLYENKRDKTS